MCIRQFRLSYRVNAVSKIICCGYGRQDLTKCTLRVAAQYGLTAQMRTVCMWVVHWESHLLTQTKHSLLLVVAVAIVWHLTDVEIVSRYPSCGDCQSAKWLQWVLNQHGNRNLA